MEKNFYDRGMVELFRHPSFVKSLLTDIIREEWVSSLDLSSIRIEDGVHKEIGKPNRFNDLLVSFEALESGGPGLSIYLLIEFQHGNDPISLRLLEYLSRVYRRQHVKGSDRLRPLHPVVPIVIYNGNTPWREEPCLLSRFPNLPESLRPYIPGFCYFLLDESRYDDQQLSRLKGAVGAFIRLDRVGNLEATEAAAKTIIGILNEMSRQDTEVTDLLSKYIEGLLSYRGIENRQVTKYIKERRMPMLAQELDRVLKKKWNEGVAQGKTQGRKKGLQEGRQEGKQEGKQETLLYQLEKKFSLTEDDAATVCTCTDLEKLDNALDVILFASEKQVVLEALR
jgi:hypothetical protein